MVAGTLSCSRGWSSPQHSPCAVDRQEWERGLGEVGAGSPAEELKFLSMGVSENHPISLSALAAVIPALPALHVLVY